MHPTHHTPLTLLMHQAVTDRREASVEITVDFDSGTQSLSALEAAAYRLIGSATCRIERIVDRFVCHLSARSNLSRGEQLDADSLRVKFMYLVTDENLRLRIAEKTEGVRNVILALAFGSLAASQKDPP
jgi:His-Xaa-Ser system protein HxsD